MAAGVTLVMRRIGRGNWSVLHLQYDAVRQGQLPTPVEARVGARFEIGGVLYRVAKVLP